MSFNTESRLMADSALERIGFSQITAWNIVCKSKDLHKVGKDTISIEFGEMKRVYFEDLPKLRSFSSGDSVQWPSLENVVVKHSHNLKKSGLGMINNKSQLKSVPIMGDEEHIDTDTKIAYLFEVLDDNFSTITEYNVCGDEELGKVIHNLQSSHFINLRIFRTKNCNERLKFFLSILVERSHKLEVINIEELTSIYHFIFDTVALYEESDEDRDYNFFAQLKELKLTKIYQIRHIWTDDQPTVINLGNLQILHIKDCHFLNHIFSWYPAEKLHQLKQLIIEECDSLSTIFKSHVDEATPRTKIPLLSKVEFKSLPKLRQIHDGHLEFPSLKSLMIEKCLTLTKFTTGFADPHEMLTTDGKSFFQLNEIVFDNYDSLVCVISSQTLQELGNLKKLFVSHCKELKIIFNIHEEISYSTQLLQELDELTLIDIPKLNHIVNKKISKFYQNLKVLQVKQCKSLNWLPVPRKLTNINISDCEALEKIIIIDEEERIEEKLTFRELKDVCLENLSRLSVFFPCISEFSSLQTLKIANCFAMRSFAEDSKAFIESSTTNYFFPNSLLVEKLRELHMIDMDVEKLWDYNYPSKSFCELENLCLTNNNKLLSAISSNMIMRFDNLKKLTLDKCELMTHVFDLEDDNLDYQIQEILPQLRVVALINLTKLKYIWNKEPQISFFLNLVSLYIVHCDNLKSLFSFSSLKNLGKLKILNMCKCEKMEEVISSDISKDENVVIIFPKLECLVMKDLPILVNFYKQSRTLYWPKLKIVRVSNIPRMETFSGGLLITPCLRSIYVTFLKRLWFGSLNNTISHMHENSELGSIPPLTQDNLDV